MLEAEEGLRTWAIDEPIVAGRDLRARALGVHRKAYLDYEGAVGGDRGWVQRVDGGTYRVLVWSEHHVRVVMDGVQLVGEVDLRLAGGDSGASDWWVLRAGNLD